MFFSQKRKIRNPSKMMMYKLLAQMDFMHFQATGLPILNLDYTAFPWGPFQKLFIMRSPKTKI